MGQSDISGDPVRLWDARTGKERTLVGARQSPRSRETISSLIFSEDASYLAVGWSDGAIERLEVATGRFLPLLSGHKGAVNGLAISPDGRMLVSAGQDGTVRLWEMLTGEERAIFVGHWGAVTAIGFGDSGRTVASGGADTTVRLWPVWHATVGDDRKLSVEECNALLKDLGRRQGRVAFQAARTLVEHPNQTAKFLSARVHPVTAPDPKEVQRLLAGLDDEQFDVRERCEARLAELGERVGPDLHRLLREKPSIETIVRVKRLLGLLDRPPSEDDVFVLRVVEVLEQCGTVEAMAVRKVLANGVEGARLTRAALESLHRTEARKAP